MNDDFVVAELARPVSPPPAPPGRKVALAVVGCLGLFLLFVAVIFSAAGWGIWQAVRISREQGKVAAEKQQALQAQLEREGAASPDRSAEIVAAFSADDVGVSPAELAELQTLFDKLLAHKDELASTPLGKQLIDLDTFVDRLLGWPETARLSRRDRNEIKIALKDADLLSWLTEKLTITHVVASGDRKSCTVYGYSGLAVSVVEQRWLLTAYDGSWRVADCELCDWGRWRSQLQANHIKIALGTPATWQAYSRQIDEIDRAEKLVTDGKTADGLTVLDRIRYHDVGPDLQNELRMRVLQFGDVPSAKRLEIAKAFSQPERWPGAVYVKAQVYAQLEQWPQAIEAAEEYQRSVGPTASISNVLLPHFEELNDNAKCAELYRNVLRANPENAYMLSQLVAVTNDNAAEVIGRIQRTKKPADLACSVIGMVDADEHPTASAALLGYVEQLPGAAAKVQEAKADLASQREDYVAAADHYRAAWKLLQDDAEQSPHLALQFLNSIIAAKQFDERIDEAADSLLLLRMVGDDYFGDQDIGVTRKQLRQLVEQARANHGDDANVLAYDGLLRLDEKKYSTAEQQLRAALAKLPAAESKESDEGSSYVVDRDRLTFAVAKACLFQNRVSDAYVLLPKQQEKGYGIVALFQPLQLTIAEQRDWASQLLSLHRAVDADDLANGYMEAAILAAEDHYQEAWTALPKSVPEDRWNLRWPWQTLATRLLLSEQIPLAGVATCSPSEQISNSLAREFIEKRQWDQLMKLVVCVARDSGLDPRVSEWSMQLLYGSGKYADLVNTYLPNATQYAAKYREKNGAYADPLRWLLLSLMKLERYDEVLALAAEDIKGPRDDNPWPIFVALSQGNSEEAVKQAQLSPQLANYSVYNDEELGYLARTPAALPLRQVLPPSVHNVDRESLELLLSDLPAWTRETLTAEANKMLGGGLVVEPVTDIHLAPQVTCWRVRNANHQFLIVLGKRSNGTEHDEETSERIIDDRLQQAWTTHQAWLTVIPQYKTFGNRDETRSDNAKLAQRLALTLAGEQALALTQIGKSNVVLLDAATREQLLAGNDASSNRNSVATYMTFATTDGNDNEPRISNRRWKEFFKHAKASPTEKPRVCLRIHQPGCWEDVWCGVEHVETKSRGLESFVVTPERDSLLQPDVKTGEPFKASRYDIRDYEYTAAGVAHRGLDRESPE